MAKNSIRDYDATNSNNTDIQSIDISEGCSPAGINNAIREVMADLKDVSTGAVALESPSADSLSVTGDLTVDTDTLYVDSTNNQVGIGTTSPASGYKLEIENSTGNAQQLITAGTNYNSTISFGDQTANTSGQIVYAHNGDYMRFDTNGSEAMRVDSSGNLLVGKTSVDNTTAGGDIYAGSISLVEDGSRVATFVRKTSDGEIVSFRKDTTTVGSISVTGSSTAYNTSSDYRLKENVVADWDATTRLKQLNPVRFNFIADPDTTVDGFLAHEVQTIVPEAITGTHNEVDDDDNPVYQGIDQSKLVPLLVKTIQELEARITALENA